MHEATRKKKDDECEETRLAEVRDKTAEMVKHTNQIPFLNFGDDL